ncbi:MAG: hypothetical protein WBM08_04035 [Prochlorococcaceae cyanobacterium]
MENHSSSANVNDQTKSDARGDLLGTLLMGSGRETLGARNKATLLFSDVRQFTTLT